MLYNLFKDIQESKDYFLDNVKSGNDFELKIEEYLINTTGLTKIDSSEVNDFNILKELTKDKVVEGKILLDNTNWKHLEGKFLAQPFGTQSYPDFLIFGYDYIIILEIKFTATNNPPMWNSGFPRNTGIYIYGNTHRHDITFFLGNDVLTNEERILMLDFFEQLKELETQFNLELSELDVYNTGFQVYVRKAYNQKNTHTDTETTFLNNSQRENRENRVIQIFS